jgi:F420H(2)-dependent biliverdin reductase
VTDLDLTARSQEFADFWSERHLCTLTTIRPDGTPHVVPVGVTLDLETATARVITSGDSAKARFARAAGETGVVAAVCQVDGKRWTTLEGIAVLRDDPTSVKDAEHRYGRRYRVPRANPNRVVWERSINRVLGNVC